MKRNFTISGFILLCLFFVNTAFAQNFTVKGKVTDATTGEGVVGASVIIKGTSNGTQTDANGAFSLTVSPNATLSVSYIGYITQQVVVTKGAAISIKLVSSSGALQQVVVIGYGTQRKIDNTGAVATVKGTEIAKQASTNTLSALEGKVAGVEIINNGQPGSSPTINIRGVGSIYANVQPLFVVDGVWYDDISFLNNEDIENISILKDASSTAIYGIRAANGVVLVTTKHGIKGKPTISYNFYYGWQAVTNQVKMANGTEYATAIDELTALTNTPSNYNPPPYPNPASYGTGTNWYDQILRNAPVSNNQISLRGGNDKYTYDYSAGYLDQNGIVKTNDYQRYTFHVTNEYKPVKALKLGFTANLLSSKSNDVNGSIFHEMYTAAPVVPVFYDNGKYGDPADYSVGSGANYNPEATIDFFNQKSTTKRFTGAVYGEYNILKDLKFRTSFGGDLAQAEVRNYTPIYFATGGQQSTTTSLDVNHGETRNWIWENTLTYDKTIGKHKITALAGYSSQRNSSAYADAFADSVADAKKGNLHTSFPAGANVTYTKPTADQILTTEVSEFARINYSYNDRYLLNASIRHDGASEFYPHPYAWLPAVGAGWVITNEDFMKGQHFFNNLKLRGSYGQVGNAVVPINPTVQIVTNDPGQYTAIFGYPNQTTAAGASINTVVPPSIVFEKSIGTDFGLEGSILNDKLSFEADYYNRETKNAIFSIPILGSTGLGGSGLLGNQADIRNRGFEFSVTWKQQVSPDVFYSISPNLGINNNVVLNVLSGKNPIYAGGAGIANGALATRTVEGEPIGEFYGYKVTGIFQTTNQVLHSPQVGSAQPGDFIYQDTNGDGQITSTDRVNLGNPNAKYGYGINTYLKVKNFDLTLDFQGRADVSVYNANIAYRFGNENISQDFYQNRWHGYGTSNTYPSMNVGSTLNSAPNSFYVESGAYFRMRNAQIGYTIPGELLRKWKIQSIRLFANAQNAINIFGYKGFSPEIGGGVLNQGIDASVYPLYATYNFGVNVTF